MVYNRSYRDRYRDEWDDDAERRGRWRRRHYNDYPQNYYDEPPFERDSWTGGTTDSPQYGAYGERYGRRYADQQRYSRRGYRDPNDQPYEYVQNRGQGSGTFYGPDYDYESDYERSGGYSRQRQETGDYGRDWQRQGWSGRRGEPYRGDRDDESGQYRYRQGSESGRWGRYHGQGPKGWKRSDDRIKEEVNETLARHGDIDPSNVEVKVENGEVTLEGSIPDRWMKRHMEDVVYSAFGVQEVHNRVRVDNSDDESSRERESTSQGQSWDNQTTNKK